MSRIAYLRNHPKKSLSALATLLLATGLTAGSGAYFSDSGTVAGNAVSAGTFDIATWGSGAPEFNANVPFDATACDEPSEAFNVINGRPTCHDYAVRNGGDPQNTPVIRIKNLAPSDYYFGRDMYVCNQGTTAAYLRGTAVDVTGDQALLDAVDVSVYRNTNNGPVTILDDKPISQLKSLAFDTKASGSGRDVLQPTDCRRYTVTVRLPETNRDQNGLRGNSFGFGIKVDGKTLSAKAA